MDFVSFEKIIKPLLILIIVLFLACGKNEPEPEISDKTITVGDSRGEDSAEASEDNEVSALKEEFNKKIDELNVISFDELESNKKNVATAQRTPESRANVTITEPGKYRMVGKAKGKGKGDQENLAEKLSGSIKIASSTFPLSDFMYYLDKEDGKIKLSFYQEKLHPEDKGGPAPPGAALSLTFNYRHAAFCRNDGLISWQGRMIIAKGGYSGDFRKTIGDAGAGAIEISCAAEKNRSFRLLHRFSGSIKSAGKDLPVSWSIEAQAPLS